MPAAPVFVLVHSPLVGPATWSLVALELTQRRRRAVAPSLLGPRGAAPGDWLDCVEAVRDAVRVLSEPLVLVGHSGAGLLLPAIADALVQPVRGLIFVDSGIPARAGDTAFVPPALLDQFRALAGEGDGILPPWSSWFGEDAMRELVPDEALRHTLEREMPRLQLAFLEQRIPSPAGWDRRPCAYLLLSDSYESAAAEARKRKWRVEEIRGAQHLHLVVSPEAVSRALLRLEP
jgi:pimeloyl-ACP methyl ester carboxylesterase